MVFSIDDIRQLTGSDSPWGLIDTIIPNIRLFWSTTSTNWEPTAYDAGLVIVLQGNKFARQGAKELRCDASSGLLLSTELPLYCASNATPDVPLVGVMLDLDRSTLSGIIEEMEKAGHLFPDATIESEDVLQPLPLSDKVQLLMQKLVKVLADPVESAVMGAAYGRQVLYHALCSSCAPTLRAYVYARRDIQKIDKSILFLNRNLNARIQVSNLAQEAGMSVASFHRAFKQRTGLSPLKYAKQIRLHVARRVITQQDRRISEVAQDVGYENFSQFTREYRNLFGVTPSDSRKWAKQNPERAQYLLRLMPQDLAHSQP